MADRLEPEWLAHRYDETSDQIRFVRYDRKERAKVPFLVDGHLPKREYRALPRTEARRDAGAAPLHFIFHSGFCCSTLMADCLDQPGLASSFSEPMILNDIVGWRMRGASPRAVGEVMDDALSLLARPFVGDRASVVKPSTVVNGLAKAMLAIRPQARAIVMHAPLRDFLVSIAKKGLDGRRWVRELLLQSLNEGALSAFGFSDQDLLQQTDLQVAALDWLVQQMMFADLAFGYPDRVRSLSSEAFMDNPEPILRSAVGFFGLEPKSSDIEQRMIDRLGYNSKDGSRFDSNDRRNDYQAAYQLHADEIDKVVIWADHVARAAGVKTVLPNPLAE